MQGSISLNKNGANKNKYTFLIAITFLVHISSTNDFCSTKVGNFDVHVCIQQDVFWFQISKQIQRVRSLCHFNSDTKIIC